MMAAEDVSLGKVHFGAFDGGASGAGIVSDVHSIGKACIGSDDGSKCPECGSHSFYLAGVCLTTNDLQTLFC